MKYLLYIVSLALVSSVFAENEGVLKVGAESHQIVLSEGANHIITVVLKDGTQANILLSSDEEALSAGFVFYKSGSRDVRETLDVSFSGKGESSFSYLRNSEDGSVSLSDEDGDFLPDRKVVQEAGATSLSKLVWSEEQVGAKKRSALVE